MLTNDKCLATESSKNIAYELSQVGTCVAVAELNCNLVVSTNHLEVGAFKRLQPLIFFAG